MAVESTSAIKSLGPGTHEVVTVWGADIKGAGADKTRLVVTDNKDKGSDGCTGFIVVGEGARPPSVM